MNLDALIAGYTDPYLQADYVSLQCVEILQPNSLHVRLPYPCRFAEKRIHKELTEHLQAGGIGNPQITLEQNIPQLNPRPQTSELDGVRNIIAVASGKGGVGKSTLSLGLARGLQSLGARVGLLDADIYGPSQGKLLNASPNKAQLTDGKKFKPYEVGGIQTMSLGYLMDEESTPAIWRGAMASNALQQILFLTNWYDLDYLVIDMPPGTGDIQLTLCQKASLSGALIITTPHELAIMGARKGVEMFRKLYVPVIGIVENMSYIECDACNHRMHPFGTGNGRKLADSLDVPLLAETPIGDIPPPPQFEDADEKEIHAHIHAHMALQTALALSRMKVSPPPVIKIQDD